MILAGDIGGTKTNLGLFEAGPGGRPLPLHEATFSSTAFPGLSPIVEAFLAEAMAGGWERSAIAAACFGIAGPAIDGRVSTPNLAWEVDARQLTAETGLPPAILLNDLVTTGEGIVTLAPEELATLHPGAPGARGSRALIAAGTGLGMALLPEIEGTHHTLPSEGGHADFPPRNGDEIELLEHLRRQLGGRVSLERVLSGPGLANIYHWLREAGHGQETPELRAALVAGDAAKVIAEAGLAGRDALCDRALGTFAAIYGAAAGNLALLATATGGVYVGGGIAPKILPRLSRGDFMKAFLDKGRFSDYLEKVPVRVILNDHTALLGAARCALRAEDESASPPARA